MPPPFKIFISTAEVSGDNHGADVIRHLKLAFPKRFIFEGLGGQKMRDQGCRTIDDLTTQSSVGLVESLRFVSRSLGLFKDIKKYLQESKPDLILAIDGQGRNLPLLKIAHKLGIKTAYYFPPLVFVWGKWNVKKLKNVDLLLCPFKRNAEYLKKSHSNVVYTGHPFSVLPEFTLEDRLKAKKELGFSSDRPVIAIFPGSRYHEVEEKTRVFLRACRNLREQIPNLQFVLSISHPDYHAVINPIVREELPETVLLGQDAKTALLAADFLFTVSGTATLEACFYAVPMAIGYKIAWLSYQIGKLIVHVDHIGMPNILAGKTVYPEFINRDLTVENLVEFAKTVLTSEQLRGEIRNNRDEIIENIRVDDPYASLCDAVYRLLT